MTAVNAVHVLDDFLEAVENVPSEFKSLLKNLHEKDIMFEEGRKSLFKKRNLYLHAEEKNLEEGLRSSLLKKIEKEHIKLLSMIEEKIELEERLRMMSSQYAEQLGSELNGKLGMELDNTDMKAFFSNIPRPKQ